MVVSNRPGTNVQVEVPDPRTNPRRNHSFSMWTECYTEVKSMGNGFEQQYGLVGHVESQMSEVWKHPLSPRK